MTRDEAIAQARVLTDLMTDPRYEEIFTKGLFGSHRDSIVRSFTGTEDEVESLKAIAYTERYLNDMIEYGKILLDERAEPQHQ